MALTPETRVTAGDALVSLKSVIDLRVTRTSVLAAMNFPSPFDRVTQVSGLVTVKSVMPLFTTQAAELVAAKSSAPLNTTNAVVLVAAKGIPETHRLRAWTFTQDDHDFYVLGLGVDKTLVLDLLTNQWSTWNTEAWNGWRTSTGMAWDNDNVAGDLAEGIVWNISAAERADDFSYVDGDNRPIISVMRGLLPLRLRNALSCARATLTVSEGAPVAGGVGITLRTSDDFGYSWHDHGFVTLDDATKFYDISWASLGLVTAPGRIFEIEDTGYAARIDALDVDLGSDEGKVEQSG